MQKDLECWGFQKSCFHFMLWKSPFCIILPWLLDTCSLCFSSDPGRLLSLQGAWLWHSAIVIDSFLTLLPGDEGTHVRGILLISSVVYWILVSPATTHTLKTGTQGWWYFEVVSLGDDEVMRTEASRLASFSGEGSRRHGKNGCIPGKKHIKNGIPWHCDHRLPVFRSDRSKCCY